MIGRAIKAPSFILRGARISDPARLADIAVASYRAAFCEILAAESLAKCDALFFALRFARESERIRLAEKDGAPLGFTLVTQAHLDMLFVSPDRTGQGIGAALLADAEARGTRTLEIFRDNFAARRFYERHGWLVARSYERDFLGRRYAFVHYAKP
jgi:putative acetyltransferase